MAMILVGVDIMARRLKRRFSLMTKLSLKNMGASLDQEQNQVIPGIRKSSAKREIIAEVIIIIEMALNTFKINYLVGLRWSGGMMTGGRITMNQSGKEFTKRERECCMARRKRVDEVT